MAMGRPRCIASGKIKRGTQDPLKRRRGEKEISGGKPCHGVRETVSLGRTYGEKKRKSKSSKGKRTGKDEGGDV